MTSTSPTRPLAGSRRSVYVQTNWPVDRALDEVRWVEPVAQEVGLASRDCRDCGFHAARMCGCSTRAVDSLIESVRFADAAALAREAGFPVRVGAGRGERPAVSVATCRGCRTSDGCSSFRCSRPRCRRGSTRRGLSRHTVRADSCGHVGGQHAARARAVARRHEATRGVPQRCSSSCRGRERSFTRSTMEFIADVVRECLRLFGSTRCMFGSNFPVEKIWTDYESLFGTRISRRWPSYPVEVREDVFGRTATRLYQLT